MSKIKVGSDIRMGFHCAGVVSYETFSVTKIAENWIQINHGEPEFKFDRKTGKCLNEERAFGCYRTISTNQL